jgi:carboxymethylenebutenolidase
MGHTLPLVLVILAWRRARCDGPWNAHFADHWIQQISCNEPAAASLAVTAGVEATASLVVVETDAEIKTSDRTCDAAFLYPQSGSHPGVLIRPDALGLRPTMRGIAQTYGGRGIFRSGAKSLLSRDESSFLGASRSADQRQIAEARYL